MPDSCFHPLCLPSSSLALVFCFVIFYPFLLAAFSVSHKLHPLLVLRHSDLDVLYPALLYVP
jgi:hypothetical protein